MKKVFIASRFGEFKEIREQLTIELQEMHLQVINLDDNRAVSQSPIERSLENITKSDIVIFLLGDTYGEPPRGYSKSYTNLEYDEALLNKKNIYVYGIGNLYENDDFTYSEDSNYRNWQKEITEQKVFSKFSKYEDKNIIIHNIVMDIYKGENKVWLDEDTGLMWQVNIEHWPNNGGRYSWYDRNIPVNAVNTSSYGRYSDWRVPTFEELKTILSDKSYPNKHSNYGETFIKKQLLYSMDMEPGRFWSETTNLSDNGLAYAVYFNRRRPDSKSENGRKPKTETAYVRCVRLRCYEELDIEWNSVKNTTQKEDIRYFLKKYDGSPSKSILEARNLLERIENNEKEHLESLSPYERKKLEFEKKYNNYSHGNLLKEIQEGFFEESTFEALKNLKENMIRSKDWKEISTARNPDKDQKYKKTLEVINLLNKCREK